MGFFTKKKKNPPSVNDAANNHAPEALPSSDREQSKKTSPKTSEPPHNDGSAHPSGPYNNQVSGKRAGNNEQSQSEDWHSLYGKILGLMTLSAEFRLMSLGEINSIVTPALNAGQVVIAEAQKPGSNIQQPLAILLWARVSHEVDERLSQNPNAPWKLAPAEWTSGDVPWLILAIGESRAVTETIKALCVSRLNSKPIKMRRKDKNGKNVITNYQVQLG